MAHRKPPNLLMAALMSPHLCSYAQPGAHVEAGLVLTSIGVLETSRIVWSLKFKQHSAPMIGK